VSREEEKKKKRDVYAYKPVHIPSIGSEKEEKKRGGGDCPWPGEGRGKKPRYVVEDVLLRERGKSVFK